MKNITLKIICFLFLTGCQDNPIVTYKCSGWKKTNLDKRAEWVLSCIKNGNPMSDEEGEDLVAQCEHTGMRMVPVSKCIEHDYYVRKSDKSALFDRRCSMLKSEIKLLKACRAAGWKP